MKKNIKNFMAGCFVFPFLLASYGCGKDKENIETWDGTIAEVSEAVEGVITIETAEELAGLAKNVNEGNTYKGYTIKLSVDMDLNNKEWTPIGYGFSNYVEQVQKGAVFEGVFDGNNKIIRNLKITTFHKGGQGNDQASAGVGFIGHNRGEIKDLTIDMANVEGNHYVGVISGFNLNAIITNCHVKNSQVNSIYHNIDDSGDKAGSIAGHFAKGLYDSDVAILSNCSASNVTIKADRDAGQIVGCISNGASQENNSVTHVTVSWNESGTVVDKSNTNIKNDIVGRVA